MATIVCIDRRRVTLGSDTEILYWQTKLGATAMAIGVALTCVGDDPAVVRDWLVGRQLARLRVGEDAPTEGPIALQS